CPSNKNLKGKYSVYKTRTRKEKHHLQTLTHHTTQYTRHPETKFEGSVGKLKRRHVVIDEVEYIGKETNRIEIN
ncbi:unnamed protein product, partial [marine sediment metagenome]